MGFFGGDYKICSAGFLGATIESGLTEEAAHSKARKLSRDGSTIVVKTMGNREIVSYKNGR